MEHSIEHRRQKLQEAVQQKLSEMDVSVEILPDPPDQGNVVVRVVNPSDRNKQAGEVMDRNIVLNHPIEKYIDTLIFRLQKQIEQ